MAIVDHATARPSTFNNTYIAARDPKFSDTMMHQHFKFAALALALSSISCFAQDYCGLLTQPTAVGANPPSATAEQILKVLSDTAPFNPESIRLRDARDPELKAQGAAAQICNINQRWIFYDPDFVEQIRAKGQSNWPKYFLFAHEVAHLFNNDPQDHHRDQELQADRAAARWLTSIGASVQDLVDSVNAFVTNETQEPDYPSRCDRISGVIRAYNEEAEILNTQGGKKPLYEVVNCKPLEVSGESSGQQPPATSSAPESTSTSPPLKSEATVSCGSLDSQKSLLLFSDSGGLQTVGSVSCESSVQIVDELGQWSKVTTSGGQSGWIRNEYVKRDAETQATVDCSQLPGRKQLYLYTNNTTQDTGDLVNCGSSVLLLDKDGSMFRVRTTELREGWLPAQYVKEK